MLQHLNGDTPESTDVGIAIWEGFLATSPSDLARDAVGIFFEPPPQMRAIQPLFTLHDHNVGFFVCAGFMTEPGSPPFFFLERGADRATIPLPSVLPRRMGVMLGWAPEAIFVSLLLDPGGPRHVFTKTAPVYLPTSIYEYCKRKGWMQVPSYDTEEDVSRTVIEALQLLETPFTLAQRRFWDGDEPASESAAGDLVTSHLTHLRFLKNIDVIREAQYGNGRLDFLFLGHTSAGKQVKVCVELKRSNHGDLDHGLCVQLPEYMLRCGTQFGIFLVIDYGPGQRPTTAPERHILHDHLQLLVMQELVPRHLVVRIVILSAFAPPTPSKM